MTGQNPKLGAEEARRSVKAVHIPVAGDPELIDLPIDREEGALPALQELVGGSIEFFDALYGDSPALIVNENGIGEQLPPNRAVFASRDMEIAGYLSPTDFSRTVREGELYTVLYGAIVAVSYDEKGDERDITEWQFETLRREFGGTERDTGLEAVVAVRKGWVAEYEQMRAERMAHEAPSGLDELERACAQPDLEASEQPMADRSAR